ncbi:hypothetical protein AGMMS4952_08790 [Spirochaetia bacterium]|nr:hypothetical protein AGMMS4952_08790 [Spirochaetia bacterium]
MHLPTLVQGVFVTDISKYSAMSVLDRQNLEKVLKETESGIYKNAEDYLQLGEIANVGYALTGALTKTASGFALQVQIADTANGGETVASYSGFCTAGELENFTGVKKVSLELLAQMGVQLTPRGRIELLSAGSAQSSRAEAALAKGITSKTEVETLAYYYQAAAIDPSLAEAVSRVSVMSANISSGNIGQNVRNDIAWRDAWVTRLTETENFFRNYIKTPPPYDLVYSTDVQTGAANYANRTVELSFGIELLPASMEWFDTMAKVVKTVKTGLAATDRAETWGFYETKKDWDDANGEKSFTWLSWPDKTVSRGVSPFTDQNKNFTIVVELVNEDGVTIGRQSITLTYGWAFDFVASVQTSWNREGASLKYLKDPRMVVIPKPVVSQTVTFPAIKADLITDKLTIKFVSVDGVAAETAGRDGHIMITAKSQYNLSPHGIAAREANFFAQLVFRDGYIDGHVDGSNFSGLKAINIETINGEPVTDIGNRAFYSADELISVTLAANVTIYSNAFQGDLLKVYNSNGKKAGTYTVDGRDGWGAPKWRYTGQ